MKQITGDKYIYYCMAYKLAKDNGGKITIGRDNGYKGEQKFIRWFEIINYNNETILCEIKTTASFTSYSRYFRISGNGETNKLYVYEYDNVDGENMSKRWGH